MKVQILAVGKLKSKSVREIVDDYSARLVHYLPFEIIVCRDEAQAISKIDSNDILLVLDEHGEQMGSRELADFISKHQMRGTKRLVFFIGGESGMGDDIKRRANIVLGLSKMTFPHELVQAILTEQLYRACSIIRGEPYHK